MKKYLVQFLATSYLNIEVEANDKEEAKVIADEYLTNNCEKLSNDWIDCGDTHIHCVDKLDE